MTKSDNIVIESVHELGAGKPLAQRVALYRAHARTTASKAIAQHLFECADELAAVEVRCKQLALDFSRRASAVPESISVTTQLTSGGNRAGASGI